MYGKIVDGAVQPAPRDFDTGKGKVIYGFNKNPLLMEKYGYKPLVENIPDHDPNLYEPKFKDYIENENNIVVNYIIIAKELSSEAQIQDLQEQLSAMQEALDFLLFQNTRA